ncbi:haloacid dehalogenase [Heyndrickxia shackletonii]|uniref:Haloacid dehalogenase n=1 Tax=Heyndrickxia shackletonii TaxID=157838 RepID=A0A0Q3TMV7_9BACI|nr:Cof-type HAD-IIB family hydrolase [Heyndrickxia shackletonii]KQL55089.1 haloacid dehalogenase [Heyndrickxia shackletonii]MBB2481210.1 HAD family phosphatase [Bacillus sp. APMAM]NEZ01361.1 HAD family phosphatase [Heyndrickxia shackletonii]RTZ55458.1 HAD family phosphatase [Bacillus sp. SAJ1]
MIYKLLALNIDNTMLNSNGRLNKATKEAIEYAVEKGIYVSIVTSKNFSTASRLGNALKVNAPLVTHQGAFIANEKKNPILVKKISENSTIDLVRFLEAFHCQIRLVHEDFTLGNKGKVPSNLMGKIVFQSSTRYSYSEQYVDSLVEKLKESPVSPPKIEVIFNDLEDLHDARKAIGEMFHEVDCIVNDDTKMEIVPVGVSKLKGLLYVCDQLNIGREEVVAIGSGLDDKPLIEWAGLGVVMGNASAELKKSADWITRSNNENGVSYMIKEHFRKQPPIEFLKKMNVIK